MCGIVGYCGDNNSLSALISGLEKLEYRGYDSSGIAFYQDQEIEVVKSEGKLKNLKQKLFDSKFSDSFTGIGHTRWATHGKPTELNAHPHKAGRIVLIHNGIIENYSELKTYLIKQGVKFSSETDTEVAVCLINFLIESEDLSLLDATNRALKKIRGSYAFLIMDQNEKDQIIVVKKTSPIVIAVNDNEKVIASDISAILEYSRDIIILEDDDIAVINKDSIKFFNNGKEINRASKKINWDPVTAQKSGYKHFMLKEINEQSQVTTNALSSRIIGDSIVLEELADFHKEIKEIDRIIITACGTAWHSGLVAKYWLESISNIPVEVDYASEFRYRNSNIINEKTLLIAISQSGETADTLAAVEYAKKNNAKTISICNVFDSSIARTTERVIYTYAGPEISVASTKAFTSQLIILNLLSVYFAKVRIGIRKDTEKQYANALLNLSEVISNTLKSVKEIEGLAKKVKNAKDFLFIGRGSFYPIALEGALKLKEVSYIHAEGYPAGELKHGPIALIEDDFPVLVLLPRDELIFEKTLSNLKEVQARGAKIIAITDSENLNALEDVDYVVKVPFLSDELSPILVNIPMQFLAYYVAVFNGTDVDLPRNLAKSVTVE